MDLILGEVAAFGRLWEGNFADAAVRYAAIADEAEAYDERLAAWFRHWEGLARDLAKDDDGAARTYIRAANKRSELGRPLTKKGIVVSAAAVEPSPQAVKIFELLKVKAHKMSSFLEEIDKGLADIASTNKVEQALKELGTVLGLESSRPDHETGSGPDVLWRYSSSKAGAAIEAKSDKKASSKYTKKGDIGQFYDHIAWLEKHQAKESFFKIIAGPKLQVSRESHPPDDLRIITTEQFIALAKRAKELVEYVNATSKDDERLVCIERALRDLGLAWPQCIESLESFLAVDLKENNMSDDVDQ